MKFKREFLMDTLDLPYSNYISRTLIGSDRWSLNYELVFRFEDKFYRAYYSTGATEQQYEQPWEFEVEVECDEVHLVEKVIEVWEPVG